MLTRLKSIFLAVGKKYLCFLLIQFSKIRITITVNPLRRLWFDVCSFWNNKNSGHWQVLSGLQNCWMCIVFVLCTMFLFVVFFSLSLSVVLFSFVCSWMSFISLLHTNFFMHLFVGVQPWLCCLHVLFLYHFSLWCVYSLAMYHFPYYVLFVDFITVLFVVLLFVGCVLYYATEASLEIGTIASTSFSR